MDSGPAGAVRSLHTTVPVVIHNTISHPLGSNSKGPYTKISLHFSGPVPNISPPNFSPPKQIIPLPPVRPPPPLLGVVGVAYPKA